MGIRMNYVLVMTLSGSTMVLLYLLIKFFVGKRLSAAWRYGLIKAAVLYYLFPLPFLRNLYVKAVECVVQDGESVEKGIQIFQDRSLIFSDGQNFYLNPVLKIWIITGTLWILAAALIMTGLFIRYYRTRKNLLHCRKIREEQQDKLLMEELQKEYGIKRKVRCLKYSGSVPGGSGAFTFGIRKPVIFWEDGETDENRKRMLLKHEMQHIKKLDILWKILMSGVVAVHWYNPLVWWLNKELEIVCEIACDEAVLKNESSEVKRKYMILVIDTAGRQGDKTMEKRGWSFSLSKSAEGIKRRIMNMKQEKKHWKPAVSSAVVVLAACLNSVTVFAYEDVQRFTLVSETISIEEVFRSDFIFVSDTADKAELMGTFLESPVPEIMYDLQFMDESGNIYPVAEEIQMKAECKHTWMQGTMSQHEKDLDGSCTVILCHAERCTECGKTVRGEAIGKNTYDPCTH